MTIDKSIGWAECTWNPNTGCPRGCGYCYAREYHHRFEKVWGYDFRPRLHPARLNQPYSWRKPRLVFVSSMGELYALEPSEIRTIIGTIELNPRHQFLILTQMAEKLKHYHYPNNVWLGVTVRDAADQYRIWHLVAETNARIKYISYEPALGPLRNDLDLTGINWVIIGGRRKVTWPKYLPKFVPPKEWIEPVIAKARRVGAAVFIKDNLEWPERIREWPRRAEG